MIQRVAQVDVMWSLKWSSELRNVDGFSSVVVSKDSYGLLS